MVLNMIWRAVGDVTQAQLINALARKAGKDVYEFTFTYSAGYDRKWN